MPGLTDTRTTTRAPSVGDPTLRVGPGPPRRVLLGLAFVPSSAALAPAAPCTLPARGRRKGGSSGTPRGLAGFEGLRRGPHPWGAPGPARPGDAKPGPASPTGGGRAGKSNVVVALRGGGVGSWNGLRSQSRRKYRKGHSSDVAAPSGCILLLPHAGEGKPSPGADPAAAPGAVSAATGGEIRSEQQSAFIYPPFSSLPSLLLAAGSGRSHCLTGRPGAAFGKQQAEGMSPPKISASLFPRRLMPPESDGCLERSAGTRCDMRQTRAICPRSKSAAPRRSRHEAGALARPPRPFAHRPLPPDTGSLPAPAGSPHHRNGRGCLARVWVLYNGVGSFRSPSPPCSPLPSKARFNSCEAPALEGGRSKRSYCSGFILIA